MLGFEFSILDFIRENLSSPIMDKIMVFITSLGDAGWIWILTAAVLVCTKKYRRTGIMLAVGLLGSLVVANLILKPIVARPRPFQFKEGIDLLINSPRDFSFPSGHTMASSISAAVILMNHKKAGYYALILAVLISFSRLYLYVHFPTDVLAGAVLGVLLAAASVKAVNHLYVKKEKQ